MRVTSFGLALGALVLLTALVFGELLVAGQECVSLADNTGSAQTAQKTIAPLAQKLVLNDNCYVQSFTISLAPASSPVQLSEAAVYSDNANAPGSQLADATFDISTPQNISATTFYTFNSTRPEGIQLYVGSSYWLVVNNPNIVYQPLSATSYQSATNATIIDLGELAQYNQGFQDWTVIGTQSFWVALQGCRGLLPPSPSPSPSSTPLQSPPPSPSPSPASPPAGSPSPAPALSPVVSNVKASFAPQRPVVDMVADAIAPGAVGVRSYLRDLRVGDQQSNLDEFEVEVKAGTEAAPTTYTYSAVLSDNATRFGQEFAFYNDSGEASFDSIGFSISPGTLKWSLNLTTNASSEPFTVRYGLSALINASTSTAEIAPTEEAIVRQAATPQPGMTTYFLPFVTLPSSSSSPRRLLAKVEVFDAALVDGVSVSLHHDVVVTPNTNGSAEYVLVLEFAAFSSSLFYDPSLSLGVLLGARDSDDNSGGDDNLALIVATSVVLPVALLLVVVASVVGAVAVWHRKRVARRRVRDRVSRLKDQL